MKTRSSYISKRKLEGSTDEEAESSNRSAKQLKLKSTSVRTARRLDFNDIRLPEHIRFGGSLRSDAVLGTMVSTGERIEVKRLQRSPEITKRSFSEGFASEVDLAAELSHPHIQKLIGFVENVEKDIYWIISPWEFNGNVREFLAKREWKVPHRISLVQDLWAGLTHLHTHEPPICHGNLTPRNVLVNASNRAIITDLTSARILRKTTKAGPEQSFAPLVTTELYQMEDATPVRLEMSPCGGDMILNAAESLLRWEAPELLSGQQPDLRSDIWSAGWISCEILANEIPFPKKDSQLSYHPQRLEWNLVRASSEEEESRVGELSKVLERCCEIDPTRRPTAEECSVEVNRKLLSLPGLPPDGRPSSGAKTRSCALLCDEARMHLQNSNWRTAESLFNQALDLARPMMENSVVADASNGLGDVLCHLGSIISARESFITGREIYARIGNEQGVADASFGLGEVYLLQARYAEAEEALVKAQEIFSRIDNKASLANTSYWLGEVYRVQANYPRAVQSFHQARDMYRLINNGPALANTLYWLAQVYRHQAKHAEAEQSLTEAAGIYAATDNEKGLADASYWLGVAHRVQSNLRLARQSLYLAKVKYTIIEDQHGLANTLYQLGQVDRGSFQYVEAERFLVEAKDISTRIGYGDCREWASRALDEIKAARIPQLDIPSSSSTSSSSKETGMEQEVQVDPTVTISEEDSSELLSPHALSPQSVSKATGVEQQAPGDPTVTVDEEDSPVLHSPHALDIGPLVDWISLTPFSVSGKFGDVFVGHHKEFGRVALKRPRLDDSAPREPIIRRFLREAATWGRLEHAHVLKFMGTVNRDGWLYLVSPFIKNGNLMKYISLDPSINRIRLLRETADAINYLHEMNIIHGDIKGGNILISNQGGALLCDFGLSKIKDARTSTCMRGTGTTFWMSPELVQRDQRTFMSDVYAFGMTIAEVLVGKAPFSDLSVSAALIAVLVENKRPPKEPKTSPGGISYENTWKIAEACWAKDPSSRISMADALSRLNEDDAAW